MNIIWKTIHGISNRAPPSPLNTSITFNNKIATTPKHIANYFTNNILPCLTRRTLAQLRTNKSPFLKVYLHKVDAKTHPSPLCPLCNTHTHDTHHLLNCTHIRNTLSPLDLWTDPAGVNGVNGRRSWLVDHKRDSGEAVEQWSDSCNLTLIHNAKLSKSFNSARWKRGYNPYLIFISESIANMCGKFVMEPIPHKQHRPICARANPVVVAHPTPFRRRFNLRKTDWEGYST